MKREETMCPILTAAMVMGSIGPEMPVARCEPDKCMWAVRTATKGKDGMFRTKGYRCAVAIGTDRLVEL